MADSGFLPCDQQYTAQKRSLLLLHCRSTALELGVEGMLPFSCYTSGFSLLILMAAKVGLNDFKWPHIRHEYVCFNKYVRFLLKEKKIFKQ